MARTQKKYIPLYIEMSNRWITFVKKWAAKKGLSYGCALSQPQLKIDYRKAYPTKQQESFRQSVERGSMEEEDIRGQSIREQEKKLAEEQPEIVKQPKAKKGEVLIKVLDHDKLRTLFNRYRSNIGALYPPFPTDPEGYYYDEEDFYTLINSASMSTSKFDYYVPLANYLQRKGLLQIIKYKPVF
ncbi:MAG: hypothetical protein EBU90_21985 [Proteobacteria bacterium]|nr:hypothetical protein [Pseudomonadota bacterium]NBP15997.1 hypothetical protein [bacterium]